jgi:DNA polymerase-3 subunit epsilon
MPTQKYYMDLPVFSWRNPRAGEYEKAISRWQAARKGLRPKRDARPAAWYYSPMHHSFVELYMPDALVPKRKCSQAQLDQLEMAREWLLWASECRRCRRKFLNYYGNDTCEACMDHISKETIGRLPSEMLVIDTETTGLGDDAVILEIAVVAYSDAEKPSLVFESLVRPPAHITAWPEAQAIHGITPDMLQDAPAWDEVWPTLLDIFEGRQLASYNWEFEKRMLRSTNLAWEIDYPQKQRFGAAPGVCLMKAFALWATGNTDKWWKLSEATGFLDIHQESPVHRAAADAMMAARLVQAMKKAGG